MPNEDLDAVYAIYGERDEVLAAFARLAQQSNLAVGVAEHAGLDGKPDPAWPAEWRTVLFVELPTGQCSWHIHQREEALFHWCPAWTKGWDGHSKEEKYRRLRAFAQGAAFPPP